MQITRFLLAWASGLVVFFAGGYLLYDLGLKGIFQEHLHQFPGLVFGEPRILPALLSNLAITLLVALVIRFYPGNRTLLKGAIRGGIVAFLAGSYYELLMFSYLNLLDAFATFLDIAINTFLGALAGLVIDFVLEGRVMKIPAVSDTE